MLDSEYHMIQKSFFGMKRFWYLFTTFLWTSLHNYIMLRSMLTTSFVCFICCLTSQSTAMVMPRRSINLTTLFC